MSKVVKALIGVAVVAVLSIVGFLLFNKMGEVHEENQSGLANFGNAMLPGRGESDVVNDDGTPHVSPSIAVKKLTTSEKIIVSLSNEKDALLKELQQAQSNVKALEAELKNLRAFKENSERYGGVMTLEDERLYASNSIKSYLMESKDAARFSDFERQAMTAAASQAYVDILKRFQINIQLKEKQELIMDHLPAYAFCLGSRIGFVPNNGREEQQLLNYFSNNKNKPVELAPQVEADLNTVQSPCLKELNDRTLAMLK